VRACVARVSGKQRCGGSSAACSRVRTHREASRNAVHALRQRERQVAALRRQPAAPLKQRRRERLEVRVRWQPRGRELRWDSRLTTATSHHGSCSSYAPQRTCVQSASSDTAATTGARVAASATLRGALRAACGAAAANDAAGRALHAALHARGAAAGRADAEASACIAMSRERRSASAGAGC
jgi:hypothetical protein